MPVLQRSSCICWAAMPVAQRRISVVCLRIWLYLLPQQTVTAWPRGAYIAAAGSTETAQGP